MATEYGQLHDYATGEHLRAATRREALESIQAGTEGAFDLDGRTVYVQGPRGVAAKIEHEVHFDALGDTEGMDVDASVMALCQAIGDAIEAVYPDADVTVVARPTGMESTRVDGETYGEVYDHVRHIAERVFDRGEWQVEA